MPAAFTIKPQDYSALLRELKDVEPGLVNQFKKEFRADLQPVAKKLAGNIPPTSPLSGFTKRQGGELPYLWRKPNSSTKVAGRAGRARKQKLVSVQFKQPAFAILELAGTANMGKNKGGMTQSGLNMVQGLRTKGYPLGDRGRWVIPQWYKQEDDVRAIAVRIMDKYGQIVSRKLKGKR